MNDIVPVEPLHNIEPIDISVAAKEKFLSYAYYVIKGRALPDVRDGMKPVHRRILHAMNELGLAPNKLPKKSARIIGDVIGKFHPHGDTAAYDAMVRMAQPFSLRVPLIDGQGNFGSIDGDPPAAMRYTESRMSHAGQATFDDIGLDTVDMGLNYDGTEKEPEVLPVPFPNLLVNGVDGIAVGMATNIPPHNPAEVMSAVDYMLDHRISGESMDLDHLYSLVPAPDFPTGGLVHSTGGMRSAWESGSGRVYLRAKWHEEKIGSHRAIVIDEIPYQVNKTKLIEKIVSLAKPNKTKGGLIEVEGISALREESGKEGIRLIIEVKSGFEPEVIFNMLLKSTQLEESISYNNVVLVKGAPKQLGLRAILDHFIDHRLEVVLRRTLCLDKKAAERLHILDALLKALDTDNLDKVIHLIRGSESVGEANKGLQELLAIDEIQAQAILDMTLKRLTSLQVDSLKNEADKLRAEREGYAVIINDEDNAQLKIVKAEALSQGERFARLKDEKGRPLWSTRMTEISHEIGNVDLASFVKQEMCGIFLTDKGYLRRVPMDEINTQNKGTRGKRQIKLSDDDNVISAVSTHSHNLLLLFTDKGRVYGVDAYKIPEDQRGKHVNNFIDIEDENVVQVSSVSDIEAEVDLVFVTENGTIKRSALNIYKSATRRSGIIAINIGDDDKLVHTLICDKDDDHLLLLSSSGKAIRFPLSDARQIGRNAAGVRGMKLLEGAKVVSASRIPTGVDGKVIAVSVNGIGNVTHSTLFNPQNRGGTGVYAMRPNKKSGVPRSVFFVADEADLVSVSELGIANRIAAHNLSTTGRGAGNIRLINIDAGDSLADAFIASGERPADMDLDAGTEIEGEYFPGDIHQAPGDVEDDNSEDEA